MTLLERALSYPEIGATTGHLPGGHAHVRVQRVIGHGESTFRRAADRLMSWQMHRAAGLTVEASPPRVEQGEERFCVEWREDDAAVFTITAFSRPGTWWSRVLAPISHRLQQRYTRRYLHAL
jgi:uncharacterized protein (UPF0548 family)